MCYKKSAVLNVGNYNKEKKFDWYACDDFELQLCEVQPSTIGGAKKEFIYSGRLDNLCSVYCGLRALIDTTADDSNLAEEESIRLLAVFDHEEIGSTSTSGARGTLMTDSINRISFRSDFAEILSEFIIRL